MARLRKAAMVPYQPQFAQLSEAILKAHQPQFAKLNELVRNLQTAFPSDPATLRINHVAFEVINSVVQDVSSSPSVQGQRPRKISDREIAAMLTVAVFLLVYI